MNKVIDVGFDYSALDANDRDEVREAGVRIRLRMSRTVEDIIEIGRDLIRVKDKIGHGGFLRWIETEFGMGQSSADRFIQTAKRFGDKLPTVGNLAPSVLYALASPSTPDEIVDEVVERSAAGEAVTRDDVKALKDEWAAERKELKAQLNEYKDKAKDAKATQTDVLEQLKSLQSDLQHLRDERDSLKAEIASVGSVQRAAAQSPVPLADRPLNEFEAYEKWLAEGVRWISKGSAEWRERAQSHLYPDTPVMDRRYA